MNTYLKYQPPGIQFMAFMGLAAGFLVLYFVLARFLFMDVSLLLSSNSAITQDDVNTFKLAQSTYTVFSFLIPALLFGYFSAPKPIAYLGFHNYFSPALIVLSVLILFAMIPFVGWVGDINSRANFGSMQKALKEAEALSDRAFDIFLKKQSAGDLFLNLVMMALLPAFSEELFFRGALQKVLLRWNKLPWLSILISSAVFALLHGTLFKILPIFVLGLMLGTIYYVTRNIWYCIIIHFLNNAMAVLAVYFSDKNEVIKKFAADNISMPVYLVIISLLLTLAIIYAMKKKSDEVLPAFATDDNNDYLA